MVLYYITDRTQFSGDEPSRRQQLLDKMAEAARHGVDFIQLREKDLTARELESLARDAMAQLRTEYHQRKTLLLINSRTDVAIVAGADGVHLRSKDVSPSRVRSIWSAVGEVVPIPAVVAASCHSDNEVAAAASQGADFAVLAPIFEKKNAQPVGLESLHQACQHKIPVLALGGVTLGNARACVTAGAVGIAAIRLFQENDLSQLIPKLRSLDNTT